MPYPLAGKQSTHAEGPTPETFALTPRLLAGRELAASLQDARARTLRTLSLWQRPEYLGEQTLPMLPDFNPPAWEAGHIAWFQEFWLSRNPARMDGVNADPMAPRTASRLAGSDTLYDSSLVAHDLRWGLELPAAVALCRYLDGTLSDTLALLEDVSDSLQAGAFDGCATQAQDQALYFFRLALFHEDMHHEAALYMANHYAAHLLQKETEMDVPTARADWSAFAAETDAWATPQTSRTELAMAGGSLVAGHSGAGFAFDNECPPPARQLDGYSIDSRAVSVGDFLQFILDRGYQDPHWWTPRGWQVRQASGRDLPLFHRLAGRALQRCEFGVWRTLPDDEAMVHVNAYEAEAWCAWAGRRLPSETEWEHAASTRTDFTWGCVWEWTAHAFKPYPGFAAHPYRDYSEPWFGSRRTLKGAAFATHPRLRQPHYRNFFLPERADIFSGFRSCAQ